MTNEGQLIDIGKQYYVRINKFCYKAAKKVQKLDFGEKAKDWAFYEQLTRKAEFVQNVRRGFYCMMCSTKFKKNRYVPGLIAGVFLHKKIYYSDNFCK